MKKVLLTVALGILAASTVTPAIADDNDRNSLVRFNGGIGSQPFAAGAGGVPVTNDVLGVPPGGRPWPIESLRAVVHLDSTITVKGQGMVLGGGANVGRPAIPRKVVATLFCGPATAPLSFNSEPVDLDAAGNFTIRSPLSGIVPNPCVLPILLIRNFGGTPAAPGPWFAAGIPVN
ncbi:MAG: hypothetical protein WB821_12055 [Burkholderiaceae bacterium]